MSNGPVGRRLTRGEYTSGILRGDRATLSRAITLIESRRMEDDALAQQIIEDCLPHTGNSIRVGITGVPGAGKSSVIEALGRFLTQQRGEKVAVLAVDPTSQLSGGSILGDKTRMEALANDDLAFIRPSPSGGSLGGVARRTREAMLLCEAAGFQNVIVETVGVGQSETAVRTMVDFFLLLMLTDAGDELQGMKRGVMEMADLIAINKADGENRERAALARQEFDAALHLFPAPHTGWTPRVTTCSAREGSGIADLWSAVLEHDQLLRANGWRERIRREQVKTWMYEIIEQALHQQFQNHPAVRQRIQAAEQDVLEGRVSSFRAAKALLDLYRSPASAE